MHWYRPIVYPALTAASSHFAPPAPSLVLPFGVPETQRPLSRSFHSSRPASDPSIPLCRTDSRVHPPPVCYYPESRPSRGASCIRYTKMHYYVDTYTNSIPRKPRHVTSWYMIREARGRCARVTRIQAAPRNVSNRGRREFILKREFQNLFRKHLTQEFYLWGISSFRH